MSGPLPATPPHGIRTGSWLAREARTNANWLTRCAVALCVTAAVLSLAPLGAWAARHIRAHHAASHLATQRPIPYPNLPLPLEMSGSQYIPLAWADIPGWSEDDHLAAYNAFRTSCKPIAAQHAPPSLDVNGLDVRALGLSLRDPCVAARAGELSD